MLEKTEPFKAVLSSTEPLVYGSEKDALADDPRWHPLCIFPGGVILDADGAHIASGVNDCAIVIQHIRMEELRLAVIAPKIKGAFVRVRLLADMIVNNGHFGMNGQEIELSRSEAMDLVGRRRAEVLPDEYFPPPSLHEQESALLPKEERRPERKRRGRR